MQRIAMYTRNPASFETDLRTWLVTKAPDIYLKKRGTRKRRREALPEEVLKACRRAPAPPDPRSLKTSTPRQGSPEPRKKANEIIVGGLS